jgi:hypothetical protein
MERDSECSRNVAPALLYLKDALKEALAHNGDFDYQRTTLAKGSSQQLLQFRMYRISTLGCSGNNLA